MSQSQIIVLDVGGTYFRTTKSTLTIVDSFFNRMLSDMWKEGSSPDTSGESFTSPNRKGGEPTTIFIDRDPLCFPAILSYLRSQQVFLAEDIDRSFLEKLLVEADYYQLEALSSHVREEIAHRDSQKKNGEGDTMDCPDVFRSITPADVASHFEQGWAFVSSFEANETASCSATGSKVTATWRNNMCSVCGFNMTYEKFVKHASFFKPTVVVVRRPKRGHSHSHLMPSYSYAMMGDYSGTSRRAMGLGSLGSPVGAVGHEHGRMMAIPFSGFQLDTDISFG